MHPIAHHEPGNNRRVKGLRLPPPQPPAAPSSDRRGFLLVEAAVGYLIVSLAVVSLMTVLILAIKANYTSEATLVASGLAGELLEEVRLRKWDQSQPDSRPGYPAYSQSAIGTDAGENTADKTTFNDIDDFNGWAEQPPQDPIGRPLSGFAGYKRTVTVAYVSSALDPSGTPTDYKLVTVCVTRATLAKACLDWLGTRQ